MLRGIRALAGALCVLVATTSLSPARTASDDAPRPGIERSRGRAVAAQRPATELRRTSLPARAGADGWKRRIDGIVKGKHIGVSVRISGRPSYNHSAKRQRVPASNQKLLLSLALFQEMGPAARLPTKASATRVKGSRVIGDLWLLGTGDPTVTAGGGYSKGLGFSPTRINRIAARIRKAGIARITGGVKGATNYFTRDWWAPGWRSDFPSRYIPLPTSLTLDGNTYGGRHISDPELRAAKALTKRLRKQGVKVWKKPGAGLPPAGLSPIVKIDSPTIDEMSGFMNRVSSNFFAEVLGKRLGAERSGRPGSMSKGAAALERYAAKRGVAVTAHDSSGLSYSNRVPAKGLAKILDRAESETWFDRLRSGLPSGGQGTLEDRLHGVKVRAKTGTLDGYSALSGWVWAKRADEWVAFSILSQGMPKSKASSVEDKIVRILEDRAR